MPSLLFRQIFFLLCLLSGLTVHSQDVIKLPLTLKEGNAHFTSNETSSQFIVLDGKHLNDINHFTPLAIRRFYFDQPQKWFLKYIRHGRKDTSFVEKMKRYHLDTTVYAHYSLKDSLEVLVGYDSEGRFVAIPDMNHDKVFKDDKRYTYRSASNISLDTSSHLIENCPILEINIPKWNNGQIDTYSRYFRLVPRFYISFSRSFPPKNRADSTGLYIMPYYHWKGSIRVDSQYYTIYVHNRNPQLRLYPSPPYNNIEMDCVKGKIPDTATLVSKHIYGKFHLSDTIPIGNQLYVFTNISRMGKYVTLEHAGKNNGNLGYNAGSTADNIKEKDIYGNAFSLSKLRGQWVLLDFWFTGCPPCIKILPELKQLNKKYGDEDLTIVSVASFEYDVQKIRNFVKKHEMKWINLMDGGELVKRYMVGAFPNFALINPSGIIVLRETNVDGFEKIRNYLIKKR